jgi:hypothetical protein
VWVATPAADTLGAIESATQSKAGRSFPNLCMREISDLRWLER